MQSGQNSEHKNSHQKIASKLDNAVPLTLTLHDFLEKKIEDQSLHIRALFEKASNQAVTYDELMTLDNSKPYVAILSVNNTFSFITNNEEILKMLCNYKPMLFDQKKVYPLDENMFGIQIDPDVIFTYASHQAAGHIPALAEAVQKSQWRLQNILHYEQGVPMLVLRGCTGKYDNAATTVRTPSYLACDGNAIVTQQLINYSKTREEKQSPPIQFPKEEGRGAVFSISNVPFHAYNSYTRNDELCQFLGLFHIDRSQYGITWHMHLRSCLHYIKRILQYADLNTPPYSSYTDFPGMQEWRKYGHYHSGIVMPLTAYISASLDFQLSQDMDSRIPREDGSVATDDEIHQALSTLQSYIHQLYFPSAATPASSDERAVDIPKRNPS